MNWIAVFGCGLGSVGFLIGSYGSDSTAQRIANIIASAVLAVSAALGAASLAAGGL